MNLNQSDYVRESQLRKDNAERVRSGKLTPEQKVALQNAVLLLAEMLDDIASHRVTHVTLGTPKAGDAFLFTVNLPDGGKKRAGCADIFDMGITAASELVGGTLL